MSESPAKDKAQDIDDSLAHELATEQVTENEPKKIEKETSSVCCGSCS